MRPKGDVHEVFRLRAAGLTTSEIARRVGIARSTVRRWVAEGEVGVLSRREHSHQRAGSGHLRELTHDIDEPAYAYLLGQYLGDGCISRMRSSFRLRITCCDAYPRIIEECAQSIRRVRPGGTVGFVSCPGCTEVSNYWLHWPCLLPHGEGGVKHRRSIELEEWQHAIAIDRYLELLLRGLLHSDGWRGINRVRGANGSPYAYPRYQFSNRSDDIKRLFCEACDRLGVGWRKMNGVSISIASRPSVALLDEFVGPKE